SLLDTAMLKSLVDNLGRGQFDQLIKGFLDTADELTDKISGEKNIEALRARAHELKGMAGNFGFRSLSAAAAAIEKAACDNNEKEAFAHVESLSNLNRDSRAALAEWITVQDI